ncbi:TMEM175 family protein [Limosilactobacillus sp.]|uniref:TMEM175 family protein n=1 Tax=Limosilactobacillus sp. TaxID=2773925 RepID=UPI003F0BF341
MIKKEQEQKRVASRQQVQQRMAHLQKKEAIEFKEHLDNLNDGVIAIILTVMVLEVPLPNQSGVSYRNFMGSIFIFLVSFFVVANFWYDLNRMLLSLNRVTKKMIINDFIFLAALSVIPMLTKWMMLEPSSLAVFDYGIAYFIANLMKLIISANAWEEFFNEVEGSPRMFSVRLGRRLLIVLIINAILIFVAYIMPRWDLFAYLILTIYNFFYPEKTAVEQKVK